MTGTANMLDAIRELAKVPPVGRAWLIRSRHGRPRCPIDDCAERIGDGQTVPPPPPLALIEDKTVWRRTIPCRRLTPAGEWRANGGRWA